MNSRKVLLIVSKETAQGNLTTIAVGRPWRYYAGGFLVVSVVLDMVASLWQPGAWLGYLSFLTAFDPPTLILEDENRWAASVRLNTILLAVGLTSYAIAGLVFTRRDIPVPR